MEEKERNYESPLRVPGGHNLPDEDCIHGDPVNGHDGDRRRNFKPGGQCLTLPRYTKSHSEGNRDENNDVSGNESRISSRKVDSLPSNITMLSLEQEKKSKRKGVLKSVGYFFQKLTRRFSLANSTSGIKIKLGQRGSSSTASSNSSNGGNGSINDYHLGTLGGRKSENSSAAGSSHALDRSCAGQTAQLQSSSSCRLMLDEIPGMIGIHNHGNTCFMNAIIQCLSNTEPLLSYFLSDQYKEDIKRANKHNSKRFGTKGELTEHLATLLKSLWLKKYTSDVSTEFRTIVGKYGSQYRGSFQHDVQEFLMWLLDKVHEDLNIATKKKYRANKSSFGRTDEDVAAEAMANHARCNNSFIHDLFQALYMSSLTCPTCRHQSNTFDPFLSVSLPIPRTSLVQPVLATCLGRAQHGSSQKHPPCRRIGIVLERGHTVKDLKEELTKRCKFFEGLCPAELLILEVNGRHEFHVLDDARLISDPLDNELLYAVDISGQSQPSPEVAANKTPANGSASAVIHQSDRTRRRSFDKNQSEVTCSNGIGNLASGPPDGRPSDGRSGLSPVGQIGRNLKAEMESEQCRENVESPEMSLVVVMNSIRFGDDTKKLTLPVLLRLPVFMVVDSGQLDVILKETLHITQEADAKYYLITEGGNSSFVRAELSRGGPGTTQAELDEVRRSLVQAATTSIGRDGSITPVFRVLVDWNDPTMKKHFQLAEDVEDDDSVQVAVKLQAQANVGTLDECFQVYTQEEMLGEDNDWHCPNCRAPKRGATKSLTLWSLPEILVIHLKRFRQDHEHRSKLNTLILFPLTGLDLRHHMPKGSAFNWEDPSDPTAATSVAANPGAPVTGNWNAAMQLKSSKQQSSWLSWRLRCKTDGSVYDLYAVCNHYGDMQGGHYTAFCRNPVTKTWCLFNDSRASPISEHEVVTRAAYLLFYKKRATPSSATENGFDSQPESKARSLGTDGIRNCDAGELLDRPGDLHAADLVPADVDPDLGRDHKIQPASAVRFGPSTPSSSSLKKSNQGIQTNPSTGPVTIPLASVESRPWLVSLLEERRRLHGLSHTITQTETGSHRISRAITSHSLDDLLDGDCDESREDDFSGVPIYTTLHPPPRIKKQQAKPPMATISTDSVPMAAVGDGLGRSEGSSSGSSLVKNSSENMTSADVKSTRSNLQNSGILCESDARHPRPSVVWPSTSSSKQNGDLKICPTRDRDKISSPVSKVSQRQHPVQPNQTFARQRLLEGID